MGKGPFSASVPARMNWTANITIAEAGAVSVTYWLKIQNVFPWKEFLLICRITHLIIECRLI